MKAVLVRLSALALMTFAGCSEPDTAAPLVEPEAVTEEAKQAGSIELSGSGIWGAGKQVAFGSDRTDAETLLAEVTRSAAEPTSNAECGAGPMEFSRYPYGLTLNFQDGKLAGWLLDESSSGFGLRSGPNIGDAQEEVLARAGFAAIADSTLGEEFYSEAEGLGGFFEAGKVASLYAGMDLRKFY